MQCLHNACGISGKFSWLYDLYLQIWNWWELFFIHGTFLVHKLETFKNCKEVNHIMIMTVATIYIFFILCGIWSPVENYFQKILSPHPLKKSIPPFLLTPSPFPENSKVQIPPFFDNTPFFSHPPPPTCRKGGHNVTYFLGNNQVRQFVKFMISST